MTDRGQQTPVVVVAAEGRPDRYVLIDGYKRILDEPELFFKAQRQAEERAAAQRRAVLGYRRHCDHTPRRPLGASEVNLLELANAYRTIASGILAQPYVIRKIVRDSGEVIADSAHKSSPVHVEGEALSLIQEDLRSVVRMPTGTARALDSRGFPIAVMGKAGTTNELRDALFIGSTYGPEGITVAVRIGFDDNRSLGSEETGGRVALPVFKEIVLRAYGEKLVGPPPRFPAEMEQRIDAFLSNDVMETTATTGVIASSPGSAAISRGARQN